MTLEPNVPNPFNPRTRFEYRLEQDSDVQLRVYDVAGRLVRELFAGHREAGTHHAEWDGRDDLGGSVASGVYHAVVDVEGASSRIKITLLK